ncbi:MAG TPA: hypothetical protein VIK66_02255 [Gaiellaceae bacterium]
MPELSCEACGWVAITTQPPNLVWAEHEKNCPAVGGAVRHMPEPAPRPRFLGSVKECNHRLARKHIATTPSGVKKYAVMCELCGRFVG